MLVAALDPDDSERRAAVEHAESCLPCKRLLERGASELSVIDAQRVDLKIDRRLKARILASLDALEEKPSGRRWEPHALGIGTLLSVTVAVADRGARYGLFPAHAWICFMWQLLGAVLALVGVGLWVRGWASRSSPLRFAAVTMGGALAGHVWLRVCCPTHDALLHVFSFHVTGVLVATLLGYLLARVTWQSEH